MSGLRSSGLSLGQAEMAKQTFQKAANVCHSVPLFRDTCSRSPSVRTVTRTAPVLNRTSNVAWFKLSSPKGTLQTVNGRIGLGADVQSVARD
jgi:hypothetical protein